MAASKMFKGAAQTKLSEKGQNLADGTSLVKIKRIVCPDTRQGPSYIVEYDVIESANPAIDPVGSRRRWFRSMTDKTLAWPDCRKFMYAALGYDLKTELKAITENIDPVVEDLLDQSCDDTSEAYAMLIGRRMRVQVKTKKTGAEYDFGVHNFEPGQADKAL